MKGSFRQTVLLLPHHHYTLRSELRMVAQDEQSREEEV